MPYEYREGPPKYKRFKCGHTTEILPLILPIGLRWSDDESRFLQYNCKACDDALFNSDPELQAIWQEYSDLKTFIIDDGQLEVRREDLEAARNRGDPDDVIAQKEHDYEYVKSPLLRFRTEVKDIVDAKVAEYEGKWGKQSPLGMRMWNRYNVIEGRFRREEETYRPKDPLAMPYIRP